MSNSKYKKFGLEKKKWGVCPTLYSKVSCKQNSCSSLGSALTLAPSGVFPFLPKKRLGSCLSYQRSEKLLREAFHPKFTQPSSETQTFPSVTGKLYRTLATMTTTYNRKKGKTNHQQWQQQKHRSEIGSLYKPLCPFPRIFLISKDFSEWYGEVVLLHNYYLVLKHMMSYMSGPHWRLTNSCEWRAWVTQKGLFVLFQRSGFTIFRLTSK